MQDVVGLDAPGAASSELEGLGSLERQVRSADPGCGVDGHLPLRRLQGKKESRFKRDLKRHFEAHIFRSEYKNELK